MANLKITQTRSLISRPKDQHLTIKGLGLKRIRDVVVRPDTPEIRGMVFKVKHLVAVEETTDDITPGRHAYVEKAEG